MTYEYKCEKCNTVFDLVQSYKDDLPKALDCDECGTKQSVKYDFLSSCRQQITKIPNSFRATCETNNMPQSFKGKMSRAERTLY